MKSVVLVDLQLVKVAPWTADDNNLVNLKFTFISANAKQQQQQMFVSDWRATNLHQNKVFVLPAKFGDVIEPQRQQREEKIGDGRLDKTSDFDGSLISY